MCAPAALHADEFVRACNRYAHGEPLFGRGVARSPHLTATMWYRVVPSTVLATYDRTGSLTEKTPEGSRRGNVMLSTIRRAGILAAAGLLATASIGTAAEPVEVTGESTTWQVGDSVWSGEPVAGLPASHQSNYRMEGTMVTSDERLSGEVDNVVTCDYTVTEGTTVGACWGTATVQNERGAWAGTISGTTTWSDTAPAHVHVMNLDYLGAGGYEGLRFEGMIEGTDFPWTVTGTIE